MKPYSGKKEKSAGAKRLFGALVLLVIVALLAFSASGAGISFWEKLFDGAGLGDPYAKTRQAPFAVHFISVGKADSILVQADGKYMLIDAGTQAQAQTVIDYLHRVGVEHLDEVVCTHPDKDHCGGLSLVLQEFTFDRYICSDIPQDLLPDSQEYLLLTQLLDKKGITPYIVKAGDSFSLGTAQLQVLSPSESYSDTNNYSVVLRVQYQNTRVLLAGDAEKDAEKDMLAAGQDLCADILKVAHHGSNNSTTDDFLRAVNPSYAVISVGDNTSGLPASKTLLRLEQAGVQTFRTDTDGTVVFYLSDTNLYVLTKTGSPCKLR